MQFCSSVILPGVLYGSGRNFRNLCVLFDLKTSQKRAQRFAWKVEDGAVGQSQNHGFPAVTCGGSPFKPGLPSVRAKL